ncbi:hypothetical protein F4556_007061 [Kitasatospora gansuensis]|uniref:Uncharacterized protein n=1 Tax=Kitasatospora gansuensis TaxID=258050 RepID=A0A7W7WLJ7_9ACTN|nr:hypothetical protein [Kitasatospora gansuensis]MBB4951526.1 hypothetical protein [Kitasatospora gansuensis]
MTETPQDPTATEPGFVVQAGVHTLRVTTRAIADEITALWNSQIGEDALERDYARVVERDEQWTGPRSVWDHVPDCRTVYYQLAAVEQDGSLSGEWAGQRLRWEFESGSYTALPCRIRIEKQPRGCTEVEAQGTDPVEVAAGFASALGQAREQLS